MVTPGPDENTIFLLHGDDIFDSSRYNISVQNIGGVTPSNTKSKFGEKSLYFNGSSYLTVSDIPFPNGTEDFTIEWWQYCETTQSGTCVISRAYEPGEGYGILLGFNQDMLAYIGSKAGSWDVMAAVSMGTRINNAWQHLAVVRNGSKFMIFNNGVKITETTKTSELSFSSFGGPMYIGKYDHKSNPKPFTGYIDELRVSNVARWTENFTPPTEPY